MADEERASLLRFGVGQRVHAAGNPRRIGTVRYVGTVDGYAGEWVGVDWDDGEGKHDGSVNGVRYFSAWGERSASLVRAKNLSAGISLIDALYMRYRGDTTQEEEDEMYVHSMSNKRVPIQLVGRHKVEEKLKRLEEIFSMAISYLGVSSIGSSHEISDLVPKLKELDLTGNLISKWQDIASLCKALPALEVLNLTSNFMADDTDIAEFPSLNNIRVLVLNNCGVTWEQVEKLKPSLASIKELHLMGNKLQRIVPSPPHTKFVTGFDSLFLLNLEDNFIGEWDEVVKLCHLRSLEQLHLNKNNLKHIYYPDPASQDSLDSTKIENRCDRAFNNLQCLLLGSNQIEDLASIDSLNFFPNLLYVRLSENPIADPVKGGLPRFVLVARLGKVKILNGSEISCRERKESEIRYVRLVMGKMQTENLAEIERLHPRFSDLKLLHGIDDEKPVTGTTGPQKMASGFLSITLKCVGPSIGEKLPLTKKLPPNTTVGRLKTLCESFFKLKGIRPRLFSQEEGSPLPQLLDDDMASLVDLGIGSEATILVDEESS